MANNLTPEQMLKYVMDNDILDIATIQKQIEMNERKKYLEQHDKKIYQDKDGNWNTYLYDESFKNGRKIIRKHTRRELEDEIADFYKKKEENPTIKSTFYMWAGDRLKYGELTKQTYDRYENDFNRFFIKTGEADTKIKYITENYLERFIKRTIHDNELTAKAWSGLRILLNGIFKYAKKEGYSNISISSFLGDLDLPKRMFKRRVFTDEESVFTDSEKQEIAEYVLDNMSTDIIALGILFAFETGLRVGELCTLKYSDFSGKILNVQRTEVHYKLDNENKLEYEVRDFTKGAAGSRKVIMTDNAFRVMNKIRNINTFGEYIFQKDGERIREFSFSYKLRFICRKLNITERSMHKIRKTYATDLFNAGVDEQLIMDQMGHTDISTTKNFYRFNNREVDKRAEILNRAMS